MRRTAIRRGVEGDVGGTVHALRRVHRLDLAHDGHTWHRPGHGAADVDGARLSEVALLAHSAAASWTCPIVMAFLSVGILLSVYYSVDRGATVPAADNEIFGHYIVHEMPVGISRPDHRRRFRDDDGLDLRCAERARHQLHEGFLPALHPPRRHRSSGDPRRAHRDRRLRHSHDHRRHDGRQRGAQDRKAHHHPDRASESSATPTARCSAFSCWAC